MEVAHLVAFTAVVYFLLFPFFGHGYKFPRPGVPTTSNKDPSSPRCVEDFRNKAAMCSKRNLEDVPKHLNEDIVHLDLNYNRLMFLYNTSFTRYPLLFDLWIYANEIIFIETGAFYPLRI